MVTTGSAHITSTFDNLPSIFDVIAQNFLTSSLRPAFSHIAKVLAEHNPAKYKWCVQYKHEMFMLFKLILERHYLSSYGSTFSENFYDLKRVPLYHSQKPLKSLSLPPVLYARSLLSSVLAPYLVMRLDECYKNIRYETNKSKLEDTLVKLWPLVNFTWELLTLVYYIRYLTSRSKVYSPLLHLCGVTLVYLKKRDFELIQDYTNKIAISNIRSVWQLVQWITDSFGKGIQSSFEMAAFFLQFLDWYYSSSTTAPKIFASDPIPPPPVKSDTLHGNLTDNICPLCNKDLHQPTVLSISGMVFCYHCILPYIRRNNKCPVTNYPSGTNQLVRLYETHSIM